MGRTGALVALHVVPNLNNADARLIHRLVRNGLATQLAHTTDAAQFLKVFGTEIPMVGWTVPKDLSEHSIHIALAVAYETRKRKWDSSKLTEEQVSALTAIAKAPTPYLDQFIGNDDIRPAGE